MRSVLEPWSPPDQGSPGPSGATTQEIDTFGSCPAAQAPLSVSWRALDGLSRRRAPESPPYDVLARLERPTKLLDNSVINRG